jgi:hypothetical protein
MFYSTFVRELIGYMFFILIIYLYYSSIISKKKEYLIFVFASTTVVIFSHHLTTFLLLLFFTINYFIDKININKYLLKTYNILNYPSVIFLLFIWILLLNYWVVLEYSPLYIINNILNEAKLITGGTISYISAFKYKIILFGEVFFAFLFGFLSLYNIFYRRRKISNLEFSFIFWIMLMGIFAVGITLGRIFPHGSIAVARRFQTFAYPFLFILSSYVTIEKIKQDGFNKKIGIFLILLFGLFSLLQVYNIPTYLYSVPKASYERGEFRNILLNEEYSSLLWFNDFCDLGIVGSIATNWRTISHAVDSFSGLRTTLKGFTLKGDIENERNYKYYILRDINPSSLNSTMIKIYDEFKWINLVYNNGVVKTYIQK